MTAPLALIFLLAVDAQPSPPPADVLPGSEARALAMAFQLGITTGGLEGMTVSIGDLPSCYRIRFIPESEPDKATTMRMPKSSNAPGEACDDRKAPELVLPGNEAVGVARALEAWSGGALEGAPPLDDLINQTFTVSATTRTDTDPRLIMIEIGTPSGAAAKCPPVYSYDPAEGKLERLARIC